MTAIDAAAEAEAARDFAEILAQKQREQTALEAANPAPRPIGESIGKAAAKAISRLGGEPGEYEARELRRRFEKCFEACQATLGKYSESHLDKYEIYAGPAQQKAVDRCKKIWSQIETFTSRKLNLIFWGTLGTGKDFLASALLLRAASRGVQCSMLSGRVYYDECSAAFSADSTQLAVYRKWTEPDVVCLSDPVFETGWSPKWGEYLNRLIRQRYDAGKATWLTVNAKDEAHAREMFGFDVWERLIENAVLIEMKWPSYRVRESKKQVEF